VEDITRAEEKLQQERLPTILPGELISDNARGKIQIVDILIRFTGGGKVACEMQAVQMLGDSLKNEHINLSCRNIFCVIRMFSTETVGDDPTKGVDFTKIPPAFLLSFCNFTIRPDTDEFIHHIKYRFEDGKSYCDSTTVTVIDLTKLKKLLSKNVNELADDEAIALFIKYCGDNTQTELIEKICNKWDILDRAYTSYNKIVQKHGGDLMSFIEEIRAREERHNRACLHQIGLQYAEKAREEGREEERVKLVTRYFNRGFSADAIAIETGFDFNEILKILATIPSKN
jgi:hypothetical protein